MRSRHVVLTDRDRRRIGTLLACADMAGVGNTASRLDLEMIVDEARIVPAEHAPRNVVRMYSTAVLVDLDSGERRICTLVFPVDKELVPHSIGVLQRAGRNILGRRVGDLIQFGEGLETKTFRIDAVAHPTAGSYGAGSKGACCC